MPPPSGALHRGSLHGEVGSADGPVAPRLRQEALRERESPNLSLGPPAMPFSPLFGWEGSPTKIDHRTKEKEEEEKRRYPCSKLSTGGPRNGFSDSSAWFCCRDPFDLRCHVSGSEDD